MYGHSWQKIVITICLAAGASLGNPALALGQDASSAKGQTAAAEQLQQPPDTAQINSGDVRALTKSVAELRSEIEALRSEFGDLQSEAAKAQADAADLRQQLALAHIQLDALQTDGAAAGQPSLVSFRGTAASPVQPTSHSAGGYAGGPQDGSAQGAGAATESTSQAEETQQLTDSKLNDLYQTKVESASKYRVRLSGIVLLDLFDNRGTLDSEDIPQVALPPDGYGSPGSFGGSLRQSQIGLEAFGPDLFGAHTSASVKFDFAGGLADEPNGDFQGLVRLRTATMRLDWQNTSIVGGQDYLFFSPLAPSSLASTAIPALSYAGNLWAWAPQVRVEHRIASSANSSFLLQGGILDSLSGDVPESDTRYPTWGEQSGYPAIAGRASWTYRIFGQDLTAGVGGFFGHQNWALGRNVTAWAGTADLSVPMGSRFTLTSAFYRGSAVGGLGGAIGQDALFNGSLLTPSVAVVGLDSVGGWVQLQFRPAAKWQINGAWGMDNPFAAEMRPFNTTMSYYGPLLSRNMSATANFIYRARSDVLFSVEYRRLRTNALDSGANAANLVDIALGYQF
jgi:hypothetical protein